MRIFIKKTMQQTFDITRASRRVLNYYLENYTLEQLNKVPDGFNNNLIWNIAHIIVVQQMLVYNLSGLPMMISNDMVSKYKKGTRPEAEVSQVEADEIKSLLFVTLDRTETDFHQKVFQKFIEFPTATGFTIKNVEDALSFNYFHEAMHIGMMMSLKKFI